MIIDCLRRTPATPDWKRAPGQEPDEVDDGWQRIRCPRCGWRPDKNSRWSCLCGCVWNTFDTAGKCPQCDHQWTDTQCLSCHEMSPHEAWYEQR